MSGLPQGWPRRHRAPGAAGGALDGAGQSPVSPNHAGPLCPLRTPPRKGFHTQSLLERRGEGASPAALPPKTQLAGGAEGRKITIGGKGDFPGAWFRIFLSFPHGNGSLYPGTDASSPAEPCKRCRTRAGSSLLGRAASAQHRCRSPSCEVFTPGGGSRSPAGGVQPICGQIHPKLEPRWHRSARA